MAKLTLDSITSGFASVTKYNANNDAIETAIENTLSRDGTSPNQMGANLDMNSFKLINLGAPSSANDAARLADVQDAVAGTATATLTSISDSGNYYSSTNVEGALQEIGADLAAVPNVYYAQSAAESGAGVTPTNYQYTPDPYIDPRRYGLATGASASTNSTALSNALSVASQAGGSIIKLPVGAYSYDTTLTIPSKVQLIGNAIGFGSYSSTTLNYTGSSIAIQVDGYYVRLADFSLKQAGTGTVGVYVTSTQFLMDRVNIMPTVSTGFSVAGYQSNTASTVFKHTLRQCYIYGNTIGINFPRGNNFTIDNCFLESNGTNIKVADVAAVTNFVVCNGSVIELFGDGRAAETSSGINIDLHDTGGVINGVIRDSYFEVDGAGDAGSSGQLAINVRKASGLVIQGNYMYGGGQATRFINCQANAVAVDISGNTFSSLNGYAVSESTGASVSMGINKVTGGSSLGDINRTITCVTSGITEGGSGTLTYQITGFNRRANEVEFTAKITPTSTATTASTKGTSYIVLPNPMPAPSEEGVFTVTSTEAAQSVSGQGMVSTTSRLYLPTWSAANKTIIIKGRYKTAQV